MLIKDPYDVYLCTSMALKCYDDLLDKHESILHNSIQHETQFLSVMEKEHYIIVVECFIPNLIASTR